MSLPDGATAEEGKLLQDLHDIQSRAYEAMQHLILTRDVNRRTQTIALQQQVADLTSERDLLMGKVDTLNKTNADLLENRIKPLEAQKEEASRHWTEVSSELKWARSELHDTQMRLGTARDLEWEGLQLDHTEATRKLTAELEQSKLNSSRLDVDSRTQTIALQQQVADLTSERDLLVGKVDTLNKTNADLLENRIKPLEAQKEESSRHRTEVSSQLKWAESELCDIQIRLRKARDLEMENLQLEHTEATRKLTNELEQSKLNSSRLADQLRTAQAKLVVATTLQESGINESKPNVAAEEEIDRLRKRNEELEKQLRVETQLRVKREASPPPEIITNPRKRQRTSTITTSANVDVKPKLEPMARPETTQPTIATGRSVPVPANPEVTRGVPVTSSTSQPSQQPQGPHVAQLSQQSQPAQPRPVRTSTTAPSRAASATSDPDRPQRRQPSRRARYNKSFADAERSSNDEDGGDGEDDFSEPDEEDVQHMDVVPKRPRPSRGASKGHPDPDTMLGTPGMGKSYKRFRLRGIGALPVRCITRSALPENSLSVSQIACFQFKHNILAPAMPRTDGIIFVGLGDEAFIGTKEDTNTIFELFVCFAPTLWTYMGRYNFERIEPLSLEDWNNKFDESDRSAYAAMHASRKDSFTTTFADNETVTGVRHAYDTGELRVPQVYCRYLGFHPDMQKTLDAIPEPRKKR